MAKAFSRKDVSQMITALNAVEPNRDGIERALVMRASCMTMRMASENQRKKADFAFGLVLFGCFVSLVLFAVSL